MEVNNFKKQILKKKKRLTIIYSRNLTTVYSKPKMLLFYTDTDCLTDS